MKKKEKLFFVAMFFLLGLIWLLILWPEDNKPQVILTSTSGYTNTPTVTITVTPTQTNNQTATYTPVISPTLIVATISPTSTITATETIVLPVVPTYTVMYRIIRMCDPKYQWEICYLKCCE